MKALTPHARVQADAPDRPEKIQPTRQEAESLTKAKANGPDLLIVAANARSLVANRGDLIAALKARNLRVEAAVPIADYLDTVNALDIPIHTFDLGRTGINPIHDVRTVWQLVRLMRQLRPKAVFGYTIKPVVYGSIAARLAGVNRVYSMITGLGHTFTTDNAKTRVLRRLAAVLYRTGFAASTRVFFQNPDDLQEFLDRDIIRNRAKIVRINGSGVNTTHFAWSLPPKGNLLFLFIGRLLTEKGVAEFVEAAGLVKARWPKAAFVAVGPHDPGLPHAVRESDLARGRDQGIVQFVGGVADVRPWLRDCAVFVLPSYREGTPRSVLEAMSTGRPIVTSDVPGCRETVVHGRNGYLVPAKNSGALAERMMCFLENPELVARMGEQSRFIVEDKYDVHKVNSVILEAMGFA